MPDDKPKFNPSASFEVVAEEKPKFNPDANYEPIDTGNEPESFDIPEATPEELSNLKEPINITAERSTTDVGKPLIEDVVKVNPVKFAHSQKQIDLLIPKIQEIMEKGVMGNPDYFKDEKNRERFFNNLSTRYTEEEISQLKGEKRIPALDKFTEERQVEMEQGDGYMQQRKPLTPLGESEGFARIMSSPADAFTHGIIGGWDKLKETGNVYDKEGEIAATGNAVAAVTHMVMGGLNLLPAMAAFTASATVAGEVAPEATEAILAPITAITDPQTEGGKSWAQIGDFLAFAGVLGGAVKGKAVLKGKGAEAGKAGAEGIAEGLKDFSELPKEEQKSKIEDYAQEIVKENKFESNLTPVEKQVFTFSKQAQDLMKEIENAPDELKPIYEAKLSEVDTKHTEAADQAATQNIADAANKTVSDNLQEAKAILETHEPTTEIGKQVKAEHLTNINKAINELNPKQNEKISEKANEETGKENADAKGQDEVLTENVPEETKVTGAVSSEPLTEKKVPIPINEAGGTMNVTIKSDVVEAGKDFEAQQRAKAETKLREDANDKNNELVAEQNRQAGIEEAKVISESYGYSHPKELLNSITKAELGEYETVQKAIEQPDVIKFLEARKEKIDAIKSETEKIKTDFGVTQTQAEHLLSYTGSYENLLKSKKSDLVKIPNIGESTAEKIINQNKKLKTVTGKKEKVSDKKPQPIKVGDDVRFTAMGTDRTGTVKGITPEGKIEIASTVSWEKGFKHTVKPEDILREGETSRSRFDKKVDDVAEKVKALNKKISPKLPKGTQKLGTDFDTLVDTATGIIKKAYKVKGDINAAIEKAIRHIKRNWDKTWGEFKDAEKNLRDAFSTLVYEGENKPVKTTIGKSTGLKPQIKKVTVNEKQALKDQLRLEAKAAKEGFAQAYKEGREALKESKEKQKSFGETIKDFINESELKGKLNNSQAKALIKRAANVRTENQLNNFLEYADKVIDDVNYVAQINTIKKLQDTAGKKKHPAMNKAVKDFLNINPENIPDNLMPKYIQALDELGGRAPSYKTMQEIYYDIEALKIKPDTYSNVKTYEEAVEKYDDIALNKVESIEDYRNLFKDINGFKRRVNELHERGDITEQQFNDLIEQVGKDQAAVEAKYAPEITSLKTDLINELKDRIKSVGITNMTAENKQLMNKFFDLDNNDLRNLSPEELYNLHSIFDNIIEDRHVDVFRLNPIIAKAEAVTESKGIVSQIEKAKPFTQNVKEAVAKLGTLTSSFWEGSLGLGSIAYGEFHKNIISPMQRAAGDYINFLNTGQTNFVKLKNKHGIKENQMNKVGMVAMYLREYALRHNPEYKGGKDKLGNKFGERDWFKHLLESDYEKSKISKDELKSIQEAWDSFGKKDGVSPEEVYNSFVNNTTEFLSAKEMSFLKEAMEWKDENMTGKQSYANELRGKPFEELLFHIKRIRKDGKQAQGDIFELTEKGNVRIAAGSGKEVLTEEMGVIETNFEKIFTETLEENARDYYFTPMLQKVNSVIKNTKEQLPENKKAYMDAASQNLQAALNNEFTPSKVNPIIRNLIKAKAAQILIAPIRTVNELISSLVTYPMRAKSMNSYTELFKPRKAVRQLLQDTESPLRNRQNLNKYVELEQGKIKPKGLLEKATHYLSALPELLGLEPVWMATFKNRFKEQTGATFSESEYLSNAQYKHKFNKQIKDAGSVADATYEKIAGATTAAGQRRTIKILPSAVSKAMGLGEGLDAKKSSGSIAGFMTGYTQREILQVYDSFSAFYQAAKDAEYSKGDAAKTLLPVLGSVLGVTAYNYGQQISFSAQNLLTGDDDDKREARKELEKLTTAKGVFTEMATGSVALAGSKYSGAGRQLIKLVASVYYNYADKPEEKEYVKSIVRNITYSNPFDASKSKYLMRGQIALEIADAIVPISTIIDNFSRAINSAGGAKYLYEKVANGEVLTEPEKEAVLLMQLSVNTFNAIAMFGGKAIPNTFINRIAKEYEPQKATNQNLKSLPKLKKLPSLPKLPD